MIGVNVLPGTMIKADMLKQVTNMKISILICLFLFSCVIQNDQKPDDGIAVPCQMNQFIRIYKPAGDTFPGPATRQLEAGKYYDTWIVNDHTFIQGSDGIWHIFGRTHPITSTENVHEGEFLSFHAHGADDSFKTKEGWMDLPKILPPSERPGERLENHAPFIQRKNGIYHMVYGPSPIRLAVSNDLLTWELKGELFNEPEGARDPSIIFDKNLYHIIYCTERKVKMRTSSDMLSWSESITIFESFTTDPESPSIIKFNNSYYLFVCGWNGIWDKKDIQGAYQHKTFVYHSGRIDDFQNREPITTLSSHAPEIIKYRNKWYISSAEWPERGVSIDELNWKTDSTLVYK